MGEARRLGRRGAGGGAGLGPGGEQLGPPRRDGGTGWVQREVGLRLRVASTRE